MYPNLFSIGPLTIHTYGVFVAMGFLSGILISIKMGKAMGITSQQVMDMGFVIILSGLIGSHLAYVFMNLSYYRGNPFDILKIWDGGLVFSGGLIAVAATMFIYAKKKKLSVWRIGDLWSPAAALGQAIGRVGCFMAGCCFGRPTHLIWGVTFRNPESLAPLNIPLHPTQLYSALSGFIIFIILSLLSAKKKFEGQIFIWFLILHSTARLLLERFRGDNRGPIPGSEWTVTQLISISILIISVLLLFIVKSRHEKRL
ncbi:MAG: prolipoprotein diacylglyceryl transferase [Deltaproteobacteria bacterium]|nr:prolipoprotein diacylglyceryl transferase [Deltaproteobacteria bacterium]